MNDVFVNGGPVVLDGKITDERPGEEKKKAGSMASGLTEFDTTSEADADAHLHCARGGPLNGKQSEL